MGQWKMTTTGACMTPAASSTSQAGVTASSSSGPSSPTAITHPAHPWRALSGSAARPRPPIRYPAPRAGHRTSAYYHSPRSRTFEYAIRKAWQWSSVTVAAYSASQAQELEVHADEYGDKAYDEGQGVHWVTSVEALEDNEGCDDGGHREADVVKRVPSG
ncbi:hypothetical protein BJV78DRAFT_1356676 [Lactifluus subvellereus]|nr:hypothetical protein BJV78DRAFT_1356676 [Lactifluus subvellereus]